MRQDGRSQRGDALAQRHILPPLVAGIRHGSSLAHRRESGRAAPPEARCVTPLRALQRQHSQQYMKATRKRLSYTHLFYARSCTVRCMAISVVGLCCFGLSVGSRGPSPGEAGKLHREMERDFALARASMTQYRDTGRRGLWDAGDGRGPRGAGGGALMRGRPSATGGPAGRGRRILVRRHRTGRPRPARHPSRPWPRCVTPLTPSVRVRAIEK